MARAFALDESWKPAASCSRAHDLRDALEAPVVVQASGFRSSEAGCGWNCAIQVTGDHFAPPSASPCAHSGPRE